MQLRSFHKGLFGCALSVAACATEMGEPAVGAEQMALLDAEMQALQAQYPEAVRVDERTLSFDDGSVELRLPLPESEVSSDEGVGWRVKRC